eukprot:IDg18306t1
MLYSVVIGSMEVEHSTSEQLFPKGEVPFRAMINSTPYLYKQVRVAPVGVQQWRRAKLLHDARRRAASGRRREAGSMLVGGHVALSADVTVSVQHWTGRPKNAEQNGTRPACACHTRRCA